jgi:hypothetical protein
MTNCKQKNYKHQLNTPNNAYVSSFAPARILFADDAVIGLFKGESLK